jgi:hypothetical protein
MRYTLWQRDVLIGETDFQLGRMPDGRRAGVFHPAPSGMSVLPALTAMAPALFGLGEAMGRLPLSDEAIDDDPEGALAAFEQSPEGRRLLAAAEQMAELELRDGGGRPIAFESILVTDLRELASLGVAHAAVGEPNRRQRDPVRYVISVTSRNWSGTGAPKPRIH